MKPDLSEEWKKLEKELAKPAPPLIQGQTCLNVDTSGSGGTGRRGQVAGDHRMHAEGPRAGPNPASRMDAVKRVVAMKLKGKL